MEIVHEAVCDEGPLLEINREKKGQALDDHVMVVLGKRRRELRKLVGGFFILHLDFQNLF